MKFEYPAFIAKFYDTIYAELRDSVDHQYYLNQACTSKGRVLEIGVGTGRLFIDALQHGVDIFGIDVSPSMLEILKSRIPAEQHYRVSHDNAISFSHSRTYALIVVPFRVFSHLIRIDEQIAALNTIYDHLEDGGICIFDLFVPDLRLLQEGMDKYVDFEGEYAIGEKVKRLVTMRSDLVNQLSHIRFDVHWSEKGKQFNESWEFEFRYYFRFELEHLMARTKFSEYYIFGSFSGEPLSKDSKEFIIKCTK